MLLFYKNVSAILLSSFLQIYVDRCNVPWIPKPLFRIQGGDCCRSTVYVWNRLVLLFALFIRCLTCFTESDSLIDIQCIELSITMSPNNRTKLFVFVLETWTV